eukprot:RCo016381
MLKHHGGHLPIKKKRPAPLPGPAKRKAPESSPTADIANPEKEDAPASKVFITSFEAPDPGNEASAAALRERFVPDPSERARLCNEGEEDQDFDEDIDGDRHPPALPSVDLSLPRELGTKTIPAPPCGRSCPPLQYNFEELDQYSPLPDNSAVSSVPPPTPGNDGEESEGNDSRGDCGGGFPGSIRAKLRRIYGMAQEKGTDSDPDLGPAEEQPGLTATSPASQDWNCYTFD